MTDRTRIVPVVLSERPSLPSMAEEGGDVTKYNEAHHFVIPYVQYLCERQQLAIQLLLTGEREGKVAEKIGVCRQTIWRWRNDIHFQRALAAGRRTAFAAAIDRLRALVPEAVDRVEEQLDSGNAMAPFRVLRLAVADRPESIDPAE